MVYKGFFDGFSKTLAAQGVRGLYAGLGAVLAGAAPAQAMFFTGMKLGSNALEPFGPSVADFGSGICAQLCGSVFWVPMEVIKEKMMIQGPSVRASVREGRGGDIY